MGRALGGFGLMVYLGGALCVWVLLLLEFVDGCFETEAGGGWFVWGGEDFVLGDWGIFVIFAVDNLCEGYLCVYLCVCICLCM